MEYLTVAYVLIVVGLGLIVGELFFSTGGLLFVGAAVAVVAGVLMTFLYGDTATGVLTLVGVFIAVPLLTYLMVNFWSQTMYGKRLMQPGPVDGENIATMHVDLVLEKLRGKFGRDL